MKIDVFKLNLNINSILKNSDAEKLRGFLGNLFLDNPIAHSHKEEGNLIYQYPQVQYKIIDNSCILIGFNKGIEIIIEIFHNLKTINIDGKIENILTKDLEKYSTNFNIETNPLPYTFLTPWLALNESNYKKYIKFGDDEKKRSFLEKILIGNLLSISKSLGYTVPEPIKPNITEIKEVQTKLKGTPMLGFLGDFSVNFEIPDYWGIGKSVSRGFGTVVRKT